MIGRRYDRGLVLWIGDNWGDLVVRFSHGLAAHGQSWRGLLMEQGGVFVGGWWTISTTSLHITSEKKDNGRREFQTIRIFPHFSGSNEKIFTHKGIGLGASWVNMGNRWFLYSQLGQAAPDIHYTHVTRDPPTKDQFYSKHILTHTHADIGLLLLYSQVEKRWGTERWKVRRLEGVWTIVRCKFAAPMH